MLIRILAEYVIFHFYCFVSGHMSYVSYILGVKSFALCSPPPQRKLLVIHFFHLHNLMEDVMNPGKYDIRNGPLVCVMFFHVEATREQALLCVMLEGFITIFNLLLTL